MVGTAVIPAEAVDADVSSNTADTVVTAVLRLPFENQLPISFFDQIKKAATRTAAAVNVKIRGPCFFFLRFVLSSRCGIGAA